MHGGKALALALLMSTVALGAGCAAPTGDEDEELTGETEDALTSCKERTDKAYNRGKPTAIKVIEIDGKAISKTTGHAFLKMQAAAKAAGVTMRLNSGFRTMAEQERLYQCYLTKRCNNGNLAAKPGYSNHQNGLAIDVSTSSWLAANGTKFGFVRTVPSEPWHWEYKGKDPGGPCTTKTETADAGAGADTGATDAAMPGTDAAPAETSDPLENAPGADDDGEDDDSEDDSGPSSHEEEEEPVPTKRTPAAAGCTAAPGSTDLVAPALLALGTIAAGRRRRRR